MEGTRYKMVRLYLGSCHAAIVLPGGERRASWARESAMMRQFLSLLFSLGWSACTALWPGGISTDLKVSGISEGKRI